MATLEAIDAEQVLPSWTRPTGAAQACFGNDWATVAQARPDSAGRRTVVFASYENPKGASGGILAVIRRLPTELRRYLQRSGVESDPGTDLVRLSPLHTNLKTKYASKDLKFVAGCIVRFGGRDVNVTVHQVTIGTEEQWYVFSAEGFFEADGGVGGTDPYIYSGEDQQKRDGDESFLLRDSLFASKAVPTILAAMRRTRNLIVHAQDWEFASTALTVREAILDRTLESAAVVLTLHNPYDHGLSETNVKNISERYAKSHHWPAIGWMERSTVLTRMIPLLDAPVSVVSHQFAYELTEAPIQTGVFTGHQQGVFDYQGLVGIDNGDFGSGQAAPFSPAAIASAQQGDSAKILSEKAEKRAAMLLALTNYLNDIDPTNPETLTLGNLKAGDGRSLVEMSPNIPLFMMVGRLDPGQKGYDVCAQLIKSLPAGTARFVVTPMSPLAHDASVRPFLKQLEDLTQERPGQVVVFAHRMKRAYIETMGGATYGLWPSRYEPFGGANEFYACGTPVIAHAVGGLVQQVVGYETPSEATGFLYRSLPTRELKAVLKRQYREAHTALPEHRMSVPVYRDECDNLRRTALNAIDVFQQEPQAYGAMLGNLVAMLGELGWEKPAQDYLQWYDVACR
jgi:glycogen synthase